MEKLIAILTDGIRVVEQESIGCDAERLTPIAAIFGLEVGALYNSEAFKRGGRKNGRMNLICSLNEKSGVLCREVDGLDR